MYPTQDARPDVFVSTKPGRSKPSRIIFIPDASGRSRIVYAPGNGAQAQELRCTEATPLTGDAIRYHAETDTLKLELVHAGKTVDMTIKTGGETLTATDPFVRDDTAVFDGEFIPLPRQFKVRCMANTIRGHVIVARDINHRQVCIYLNGVAVAKKRISNWCDIKLPYGFDIRFSIDGVEVMLTGAGCSFGGQPALPLDPEDYEFDFSEDGSRVYIHRLR